MVAIEARGADSTPTSISVVSSANPSVFGQAVSLTAAVSPLPGAGSVTFYDGTTILGVEKLAAGKAVLSTTLLAAGTRSIRAYYGGDATHAASSSVVLAQKVNTVAINGFAPALTYQSNVESVAVAIGDFNGDGKADLAIANNYPWPPSVRLGNGDGTFQAPVSYGTQSQSSFGPQSIAVGDFNGDGKADIVVANGDMNIFLGNGDGTFQPPVGYPTGGSYAVAVGDFNGDGIADLACTNRDDGTVSVFLGNGDGTFQQRVNYVAGTLPDSIVVADFNGDGKADLASVSWDGTLNVFLGNGDGTFQPKMSSQVNSDLTAYPLYMNFALSADLNGDGKADLAISAYGGVVMVLLGNGDGTFRTAATYSTTFQGDQSLAVCDFNNDGKPDLALANGAGEVTLLLGNGNGTFQMAGGGSPGIDVDSSVAVADFNGDGKADLALAFEGGINIMLGREGQATTTILTSSANPSVYGQNVTLTATVSPSAATGSVTFYDSGTALATAPLATGQAVLTTSTLNPPQHALTATYSGDQIYITSTSGALRQVVSQVPTVTSLSSSPNPSYSGESVKLTASVSPSTATGSVIFYDGAVSLGTWPVSGGVASMATTALAAGSHSLTATYEGDTNDHASTSAASTQVVTAGSQTTTAYPLQPHS